MADEKDRNPEVMKKCSGLSGLLFCHRFRTYWYGTGAPICVRCGYVLKEMK